MFVMDNTMVEKVLYEKDMYIRDSAEAEKDIIRTYEHVRLYLQRIRSGDTEAVLRHREEGEVSPLALASEVSLKRLEYTVCAAITLATHAAIEGGLDPTSAYALGDLYFQRLERCRGQREMSSLYEEMELVFARQVNLVRQKHSGISYVEKCKLFIDQHLGKPFTLDDIASALNINKSYLSRRFAQEAGVRIMEYARQKRIEAAASMLKYSDDTISAISAYLCFPTQSHFGKLFKDMMGITPLKYRTANQITEVRTGE